MVLWSLRPAAWIITWQLPQLRRVTCVFWHHARKSWHFSPQELSRVPRRLRGAARPSCRDWRQAFPQPGSTPDCPHALDLLRRGWAPLPRPARTRGWKAHPPGSAAPRPRGGRGEEPPLGGGAALGYPCPAAQRPQPEDEAPGRNGAAGVPIRTARLARTPRWRGGFRWWTTTPGVPRGPWPRGARRELGSTAASMIFPCRRRGSARSSRGGRGFLAAAGLSDIHTTLSAPAVPRLYPISGVKGRAPTAAGGSGSGGSRSAAVRSVGPTLRGGEVAPELCGFAGARGLGHRPRGAAGATAWSRQRPRGKDPSRRPLPCPGAVARPGWGLGAGVCEGAVGRGRCWALLSGRRPLSREEESSVMWMPRNIPSSKCPDGVEPLGAAWVHNNFSMKWGKLGRRAESSALRVSHSMVQVCSRSTRVVLFSRWKVSLCSAAGGMDACGGGRCIVAIANQGVGRGKTQEYSHSRSIFSNI